MRNLYPYIRIIYENPRWEMERHFEELSELPFGLLNIVSNKPYTMVNNSVLYNNIIFKNS